MKSLSRKMHIAGLITAMALSALACNLPGPRLGGPEAPAEAPLPSEDALESFKEKWRELNLATPDGPFSITFTEAELTSALASAIEQQEADTGEPIPVQDPRVVLADGQINVYATIALDVATASGLIVASPTIGPDGLVSIDIVSAEFGPLDLDPQMLDDLAARVERSINEPIQASPFDIQLSGIDISSGQMTVSGTITP